MSAFSKKFQFIFIHIPKNAGSTFIANYKNNKAVEDFKLFEHLNAELGYDRDPCFGNHFTYMMIKNLVDKNNLDIDYNNFLKFCVIRNPWERMASLYEHRLRKMDKTTYGKRRYSEEDIKLLKKGFAPWLLNTQNVSDKILTKTPQLYWITDEKGNIAVDRILNIETFDKELEGVLNELRIPVMSLKIYNKSKKDTKNYQTYYNDDAKNHVAKYFESDIDHFKFKY